MACITTRLIYPLIALRRIIDYNSAGAIILLNYRNALLLGLLFLQLFGIESETPQELRRRQEIPERK